jgi:purine-binding chemotaxis protein CheW
MVRRERLILRFRAGGRSCALPADLVVETMRPRPLTPVAGTPSSVRGVAVIRGETVPVVSVAGVLGIEPGPATRFVTVRTGDRHVALEVDEVLGLSTVADADLRSLPPLLAGAGAGVVAALGSLDAELLVVLDAAALAPGPAPPSAGTGGPEPTP